MDSAPTSTPSGGRSFVAPARLRILLAPAGEVTPREFEKWAGYVRSFEEVKIADLPRSATGRPGVSRDSPLYQHGSVQLSFVTSYDPSHAFLAPFSLHRQVLAVLGLATYSAPPAAAPDAHRNALERAPSILRDLHPGAVLHRVFAFDTGAARPQTVDLSSMKDPAAAIAAAGAGASSSSNGAGGFGGRVAGGLIVFPAVRRDGKDVKFYLRTLLAELVGSILDGLDGVVSGLEGTPLETPRETLDPPQMLASPGSATPTTPNSASSSSLAASASSGMGAVGQGVGAAASSAASRASALFSSFSASASAARETAGGPAFPRPHSGIGGGSQPDLTGGPSLSRRATSDASSSAAKYPTPSTSTKKTTKSGKRVASMTSTGPAGAGRYAKVCADASLLSGDLYAALDGYAASMDYLGKERALAGGTDAVWYASALEGWTVARVLVARLGGVVEEKAPNLSLSASSSKEKEKDKDAKETPFARQPWAEIAEAYSLALTIYAKCLAPPSVLLEPARSVASDSPRDYTHPLIHASACISYARFLLAVWASGGWNGECFDQLMYGGVPPSMVEDSRPSTSTYMTLSAVSGVQRHDIAGAASQALTFSVAALKTPDQIAVLSSLTSIFGCIGFARREAYLLRQLQAVVVSLLARTMLARPRPPPPRSTPLQRASPLDLANSSTTTDEDALGTLVTQAALDGPGEGSEAVLMLALQICETYGINVDRPALRCSPRGHILFRAQGQLQSWPEGQLAATGATPDHASGAQAKQKKDQEGLEHPNPDDFGWAEQQVALLKDTVCVTELLSDNVGMAYFAALLLRDYHTFLSADEQWKVVQGLQRTLAAIRRQGEARLELDYWGPPEPICSIEIVPLSAQRLPLEQPARDLAPPTAQGAESIAGLNNPFFWNPRKAALAVKKATLVEGEEAEFLVTLHNPFEIALEYESVRLSTSGVAFDADPVQTAVPPGSYHTVRLTGTPLEAGNLIVRGCKLVLAGCVEREIAVPLMDEASEKVRMAKAAAIDDRRVRLKVYGLDARPAVAAHKRASLMKGAEAVEKQAKQAPPVAETFVECRVVPCQPNLRVEATSLLHGAMMLYNGERTVLRIRLANTSSVPVDYVRVTCTDTLSDATRTALSDGELLPSDVYDLEWDLVHQPVFEYTGAPRDIHIPPGQSATLKIDVRGKLDCTAGLIQLDYAHVDGPGRGGRPTDEATSFFTRQLVVPVSMTVYPVVECAQMELQPLSQHEAALLVAQSLADAPGEATEGNEELTRSLALANERESCLLSLDIRNVHPNLVEISFELDQAASSQPLRVRRAIPSGATTRIVLPLERLTLSESEATAPIPSLSSRQFIVSRIKLSPRAERTARMRFWYRAKVLDRIRAAWSEPRTHRAGVLSLRSQVITSVQLGVLRREDVNVGLVLASGAGEVASDGVDEAPRRKGIQGRDEVQWQACPETFVDVIAQVHNRSGRPLKLLYRLIPLPSSHLDPSSSASALSLPQPSMALASGSTQPNDAVLSQLLIANGTLSAPVQPWPLADGETARVATSLCFLAEGRFAFIGAVEEVLGGEEDIRDRGERDRVVHVGSEPLVVDVVQPH